MKMRLITYAMRYGTHIVTCGGYELRAEVSKPNMIWLLSPEGRIETTRLDHPVYAPEDVSFRVTDTAHFPAPVTRCLALEYGRALVPHGR